MLSYFQNNKILDMIILILYRKLYINIVSIIVLNIKARQYNIKINLAISCSLVLCILSSEIVCNIGQVTYMIFVRSNILLFRLKS